MKKTLFTTIIAFTIFLADLPLNAQNPTYSDKKALSKLAQKFADDYMNDRMYSMAEYASNNTFRIFGTLKDAVLYKEKGEIQNSYSFFKKLTALTIRNKYEKNDIADLTPKEFFIKTYPDIQFDGELPPNQKIRDIKFKNSNIAFGTIYVNNQKTNYFVKFVKESGQWKVDIPYLFAAAEKEFKQYEKIANEKNIDLKSLLYDLIEKYSGDPVTSDIWLPLSR